MTNPKGSLSSLFNHNMGCCTESSSFATRSGREPVQMKPGDHICSLFESDSDKKQNVVAFVKGGLDNHHRVVYLHHDHTAAEICSWLEEAGLDPVALVGSGQLVFKPAVEIYLAEGKFDPHRVIRTMEGLVLGAVEEGYAALRATADMTWSIEAGAASFGNWTDRQHLCHYEAKVNELFERGSRFVAMCQYDMRLFHPSCLTKILTVHPVAHVDMEVFDNFYYVPPEDFVSKNKEVVLRKRIRNLKERKELEENLRRSKEAALALRDKAEEATRTKSQFLAQMSHEIRTPMSGIITTGDLLAASRLTSEQRELMDTLKTSSRYLLNILNDVLLFSKMECYKVELEMRPIRIAGLLHETQSLFQRAAEDKGVCLSVELGGDVPTSVMADSTRLLQILNNLVSNSLKFTPSGGRVTIGCHVESRTGDHVTLRFSVEDTGIGVPPDKYETIFDSFTQVDASTTRKYGGSGLGLAICSKLVKLMAGTIGVNPLNTAVGKGTTMDMVLTLRVESNCNEPGRKGWTGPNVKEEDISHLLSFESSQRLSLEQSSKRPHIDDSEGEISNHGSDLIENDCDEISPQEDEEPQADAKNPTIRQTRRQRSCRSRERVARKRSRTDSDESRSTKTDSGSKSVMRGPHFNPENANIRVLVVEDNRLNQLVVSKLLKSLGFENVDLAENGEVGVRMVEEATERAYDLVFMDIQMPVMDGYSAAARIKATDTQKHPKVVALSASFQVPDESSPERRNFDDWMTKPITLLGMVEVVGRLLHGGGEIVPA